MSKSFLRTAISLLFVLVFGVAAHAQQTVTVPAELVSYPDLIVYNGKIVAMNDASLTDNIGRTVQAMAVRGDLIQFMGANDEVLKFAGPQTKKIDLKGRTVLPGFINTHSHMHDHSIQLWTKTHRDEVDKVVRRMSVTGKNFQDLTHGIEVALKENMSRPLPGQWAWIDLPSGGSSGTGIGIQYLLKGEMDRKKLDTLAPQTPVFLLSHPAMLLNTAARNAFLQLYEVPPTDENEKLALTQDTTLTRSLVVDQYFRQHLDVLADTLETGLKHEAAAGFTTFSSHIVGLRIHDAYLKLVRAGRMPIRFAYADRFCQQVEPDMTGCFARKGDIAGLGDKYFWSVGVTLGGLDAGPPQICTTMEAPKEYKDQERCVLEPGNAYDKAMEAALRSHLRFVVNHNYGDKTMDYVMDNLEGAMKEDPSMTLDYIRNLRATADHCGFYPRPAQIPRLKNLGMVISCDAMFLNRSAPWLKVYGLDKANRIAPVKSMLKAGIMTTAEAELSKVETGESETLHAQLVHLITRKNDLGESIAPEEAIDRKTLMKMSTVWASYYVMKEKEIGTLEPGKLADFVVLNKDYFTIPESEIGSVYPVMTVLGGKTVVAREEAAKDLGVQVIGPQVKWQFKTLFEAGGDM
ncbi:MAG: amidohydrolase family protein [Acidobacteria bacterium]|nr:amidohydrolase family protein [Acidobacteriota bacterium]